MIMNINYIGEYKMSELPSKGSSQISSPFDQELKRSY